MAFKRRSTETAPPTDPEQLYRLLAGDSTAPAALWAHQADVLRDWQTDQASARDVAIELPTGSGKTLVGGLVGEFRRRVNGDRIVYVCPTRQLARQTYEKLESYGMPVVLLIGRSAEWNPADRARYTSSQAVAVSVYSHIFNSSSKFADGQVLILDDAHAAEGIVAGPWTIEIPRASSAYQDVLALLGSALDPLVLSRLRAENPEGQFQSNVYLASPLGAAAVAAELEQAIETATQTGALKNNVKQALRQVRGHVGRGLIYASYNNLLIRPLIAPTATLPAFENPGQRVYMSATLGSGGELERSFGRRKIERIPIPKGWDRQGTGRRFFCFPELTTDLSRDREAANEWIKTTIQEAGRVVVLTPDNRTATKFKSERLPSMMSVVDAAHVEDDLTVFTDETSAALVLTNRYDGVDLPNDDCRLVVVQGLPARGDLQERFLHGSLGALEVLQERVRARIVQGAGRATRNSGDYAAVLLLGDDLTSFCARGDVLEALHPDVHAEIHFGLGYSLDSTAAEMSDNLQAFGKQNADWKDVEAVIVTARDRMSRVEPPGTKELSAAASDEVAACLAAWQGEWDRALQHARAVIDSLRGGKSPQRYAALWNYLAACWSLQLSDQTDDAGYRASAVTYYQAARAAGRGTTWLSHLAAPSDQTAGSAAEVDPLDLAAAGKIAEVFPTIGKAARFDNDVAGARSGLLATDATPYEQALVYLGQLLGADSNGNGGATAAPDAAWKFNPVLWIAWEAKSEAKSTGELGAEDVRQAGAHLRYISDCGDAAIPSGSVALLVTPQARIHPSAVSVAEDHVYLVRADAVVQVFDRVVRAWRALRSRGMTVTPEEVIGALAVESVRPTDWLPVLTAHQLKARS